jgi:hypothetical protein
LYVVVVVEVVVVVVVVVVVLVVVVVMIRTQDAFLVNGEFFEQFVLRKVHIRLGSQCYKDEKKEGYWKKGTSGL